MPSFQFTKSDFLEWKDCAKSFWLERKRPDEFKSKPPSEFQRLLMLDGYAVEAQAKAMVSDWPDAEVCSFQEVFQTSDGLFARADLVRTREDGSIDIFEIKASTSLKGSEGSEHVLDACFQTIVAERAGASVNSISVIHVDKEYRRDGEIDPNALLVIVDVTEKVIEMKADVGAQIDEALSFLQSSEIDEERCDCRFKGNTDRHCSAFQHLNPDVPSHSAYLLPRISAAKLKKLDEEGRLGISDVVESDLTALQIPVWQALVSGEAVINQSEIDKFLAQLKWPLWFYDYETFGSAIPIADGHRPHQQMPVQFSAHRLDESGETEHFEFLSTAPGEQEELVTVLREVVGLEGSLVSWNMTYEKACNTRMSELLPQHAEFLAGLNERTVDLMDVFKKGWVEPAFEGSTSIKKVLPAIVSELAYPEDAVHDGTGAILAWKEMVETEDDQRRNDLQTQLLNYCKLDTLAMVEIFKRVIRLA